MSWEVALQLALGFFSLRHATASLGRYEAQKTFIVTQGTLVPGIAERRGRWCRADLLGGGTGGTKVRREQCIRISRHEHHAQLLVHVLYQSAAAGAYLASAQHTNTRDAWLRRSARHTGLEPCWTGHRARAGVGTGFRVRLSRR